MGKVGLLLKQVKSYQTSQLTNFTNTTTGIVAQLNAESDIQAIAGQNYIPVLNADGDVVGNVAANMGEQIINRMVFRANPLLNITLTSINTTAALEEIIQQMTAQAATVQRCTVTASPVVVSGPPGPNFTGVGNGIVNASIVRPSDSRPQENSYAETLNIVCTSDSYTGSQTVGNELFSVAGAGNQSDFFAFDWPLGSNSNVPNSAIDGDTSNDSGNLLTNSGFATDANVANVPDNWSLEVGTAGTNIALNAGTTYTGANSLQIIGDGSTLTRISQTFNSTTGTQGDIAPITQYSFNLFIRRDGVAPAAGVLTIDLTDNNGTVIADSGGTNNSFNINLTGLTTTFTSYTGIFRTHLVLNATSYKIRYRLSTALTNGRSVYIGKSSLGVFTRQYVGGPSIAIHSGSIPFQQDDYAQVVTTNDRGGAADGVSTFQTLFLRLFPQMLQQNLMLPSSLTPSISDAFIG